MDTQTTVIAALLTSFVVMASPKKHPKPTNSEIQSAIAAICAHTEKTVELLEKVNHERPAIIDDAVKD